MRKVMKRVCALFLALMMLMGTFSLNVFAGKIIEGTKEDKLYLSWKYYSFDKTSKTHTEVQALEEGILYCAQLVFSNNPTAADDTVTGADLWCQYDTAAVNIPNTGDNTSKSVFTSLPVTIAANNDGNGSLSVHIMTTSGIEEYGEIIESGVFFETHFTAQKAVAKTELPNLFQLTSKSTIFDVNEKDFTIVEAPAFIANAPSDATIYTSDTETDVAKKLTGTFIDASGTSMVVDVTSVTFENALTAGENVVTASYEYEGVTYTCDVTINVTADTLTKIEVTTQPKLKYFSGEALDLTGMVVTATYASNKTKELTGYTTEPEAGDKLTIAANNEKPVEVSYGGMTANTENLTVSAKIVEKPEATGTYIYDGTEQTFAITGGDCDYYTVEGRTSGTNAGSYEATASLNDTTETSWADNTKDNITLTWTIAPKAITPAIADISDQQYTGSQIKPEITVKDGETPLTKDVDYTVSYGDNIKVGENKGSVTVKAAENGNYTFSDVTAYFNIVAQAGSISITAKNAEYTGNAYAESNIEVSKNNATASVTFTYYTDANATEQTTTDSGAAYEGAAPKNAGTYYVKASMDASDNYSFAESTVASFTITKKALTITAEDKTITFGDAAPDYTFTGNGYVAGEDSSVINAAFDCTYKQGSNAGTYTITVTATAANYEISCNRGTLTVAKKQLTAADLTAAENNPTAKEYDGTAALPGVTYQVTINDQTYTVTGKAAFADKNVGTDKTVTFTPNAFNSTNYEFETDLTMTFKADITAKALTVIGLTAIDRVYDGTTTVELTGGALTGVISGDDVSAAMPTSGTVESADASVTAKPVNYGTITLIGDDAANYTLTQPNVTVTISKATPELGTVSYTGSIYPTTLKETVTLTSEATVAGSLKLDETGAFNTVGTAEYAYTFTPTDEVNYNAVHGTVSITVLKDTLTELIVDSTNVKTEYTYPQAFDTTGLTVTAKYKSGNTAAVNVADLTCNLTGPIPYGTDKATFSYTVDGVTKSFDIAITVAKGKVDLSGYHWPTVTTFTYDGNEHSIELTGSNEQVASISYTGNKATYVGTSTAEAAFTLKDADNYEIDAAKKPGTATLTITPAKRELTSTATETNPATLTKDGRTLDLANLVTTNAGEKTELMFACTGLHGCELNGSILKSGATYDVTLAITVSAGAVDVNNDGTPEYTAADDLTIHVKIVNKQDAELHVTGISETMTYGDEMEWSYNAEHGAEDGTISCAAAPTGIVENIIENEKHVLKATGVGKATVTVTYDSPEYHAEQTFTITVQPKAVTVKADDKSRAYGEANPELTWSVQDGFSLVGQDTLNLTISTTAVSESVPGSYPITLTEVEGANPNYTVTTQDGTLTVTQKTLSDSDVTINTIPDQTYTGQAIEPEVAVNGYSADDYDVTYENNIRVGTATATVHFKGNYSGTVSKTFQIASKALTVSGVVASNKVYDGTTTATITATLQGVADGDSVQLTAPAADFDTKDAGTGKAVTIAAGGSFVISGADATNYTLTQPTVSDLTADITPATLTAPGNQTVTIRNNVTTKQTVSLPAVSGVEADGTLIPASVTVSENSAACFAVAPTYEAGVITYQLADGLDAAHVSETQTVTVTLGFGGNYNTVSYQLTISITDRQPQAELTYTGATVMTYGETLTLRSAGGSVSGAVSYTVREDTGKAEITGDQLKATQAGTVYVMVHKAADADYTEASSSEVAITIRKAVPTGTPAYTKITNAGKTLADAKLTTVGGTFSVPGSVAWELPDTTTVVANRAYTWIFTPGDTTNYESISGEIVLYNFVDTPYFPGIIGDSSKFNFHDVTRFDYFYDAVKWAVDHDITSGTGRFTFSPNAVCTRAQTVTFLWRAAGSPRPVSTVNPFTDVHYGDYFYQAVLWAVENGITMGTSATTFSPDATVTRAQVVTFLWRANGQPAAWNSGFTDVSADAYYAKAVAWAVQNGITTGTGFGVFSPDAACTRAQIVTFLYRYLG
jgi:hypothetical protein